MTTKLLERLKYPGWEEVVRRPELGPCWEWRGTRNKARGGYGQAVYLGKTQSTHRLAYQCWVGAIPQDLHVLHHCDNPPCINPRHLFVGTNLDNMRDRDAKGRHVAGRSPGSSHPMSKLIEQDIRDIHKLLNVGHSMQEIAARYGVTKQVIWAIRHRKTWKHVRVDVIIPMSSVNRICEGCGEHFQANAIGRPRMYCSNRCKQRVAKRLREGSL